MFFFFKQKTAYEMRISDWSSDVCSSDLKGVAAPELRLRGMDEAHDREQHEETRGEAEFRASKHDRATPEAICPSRAATTMVDFRQLADRSEEHTSELQSLMRTSYAVFCLKKKNINRYKKANTPFT